MKTTLVLVLLAIAPLSRAQSPNSPPSSNYVVKKLAFDVRRWNHDSPKDEIFIQDSSAAKPMRLVEGLSPVWSPNGEKLAFCVYGTSGFGQLETVNRDGSGRLQLTNLPGGACPTDWSASGDRLLAVACSVGDRGNCTGGNVNIFQIDIKDQNTTQLVRGFGARWSPDESKIAFGRDSSIWVADANGKNERHIIKEENSPIEVSWFPDSKRIAFVSDRSHSGRYAIFRIDADGSNVQEIHGDKHFSLFSPAVSPDGSQVVVGGIKSGETRVLLIDLGTHKITALGHGLHPRVLWEKR